MENQTITNAQLESLTNLTIRWLHELADRGQIPKPTARGEWALLETMQALFRYYQTQEPPDIAAARLAEINSRTKLNEIKADQHHGKYCSYAEVERAWAWLAEANRAIIQGADIPPRTKADLLATLAALPVEKYLSESPTEPKTQDIP